MLDEGLPVYGWSARVISRVKHIYKSRVSIAVIRSLEGERVFNIGLPHVQVSIIVGCIPVVSVALIVVKGMGRKLLACGRQFCE